jgi:hypothetical protein
LTQIEKINSFAFIFYSLGLTAFFISGIGLLFFKNWARRISLIIAIYLIVSGLYTISQPLKADEQYTTSPEGIKTLTVKYNKPVGVYRFVFIGQMIICLAITYSFTRLDVKELFK